MTTPKLALRNGPPTQLKVLMSLRPLRRRTITHLMVATASLLTAYAPASVWAHATVAPTALSGAPLKIGVIGPFTGPSSDFGLPMLQGVQLAVEQINSGGGYIGRP